MQRKAPGGGRMSAYAARYIKPNDRLTSFERLEIYNRQYWFRVLGSLAEDFPGLRAVLGGRRFEAMCKAYLTACPSPSFTLRNLGAQLAAWLRQNPRWISDRRVLALDMVHLEWAEIEAFDGEAKAPLRSEDFHEISVANLRLSLQPYIQLLELHYPVDDLLLEVKQLMRLMLPAMLFRRRKHSGSVPWRSLNLGRYFWQFVTWISRPLPSSRKSLRINALGADGVDGPSNGLPEEFTPCGRPRGISSNCF
jgi:hypothetical protein